MVTFKDTVTPFNLSLTAPNNVITAFTTIRDVYLRVENEKHELKELKHVMVNAWMVYAWLFNFQLQWKDMKEFEDKLKSFIIWCYDIEDLIAKETLKKRKLPRYARQMVEPDKVKGLKERFGRVVKQWEDIHSKIKLMQSKISTDPYLSRSSLPVGKDDDIKKCVEMLRSCANGKGISIIGTCGLGKSMLARTIYDSPDIDNQFFQRKLVPIKDGTFVWDDVKKDIEDWIKGITTPTQTFSPTPNTEEENAKNKKEEEDKNRKGKSTPTKEENEKDKNRAHNILIVFDNLLRLGGVLAWRQFMVYADDLKKEKSLNIKVIITTRNPSISQSTFTTAYYLEVLSDDDCEKLVKQNVEDCEASPSETMLSTVKSVAKFCEGIPWVTEIIGNVIAQQRTEVDLRALEKRVSSGHASEFKEEILQHLSPCYFDMEPELRRCLAYLSLFPKNHSFDRATLAHLWVAECFFEMDKELTILQQIDKYVNELTARSILQLQPRGRCCKLQYCSQDFDESTKGSILQLRLRGLCSKLQYCGQDFAMLAASGTCLHLEQGGPSLSSLKPEVRHLSLSGELDGDIWTTLVQWKIKLRTFLSLYTDENRGHLGTITMDLKESLSRLRVFSLTATNVENLPEFFDALTHLRYLDISFTHIQEIPTKFPKHHPLQFLKFKSENLSEYKWLPNEVNKLTNLIYVDWGEGFLRRKQVPPHIGNITHLENLPFFRVGTQKGHFISELGGMDHLQGSICIENLESVEESIEKRELKELVEKPKTILDDAKEAGKLAAEKAMLHRKCGLRTIVLQWNSKASDSLRCAICEGTLTGLEPHSNVKELIIRNYGGDKFPEWMSRSALKKIRLKECRPDDISAFGKMKNLETLVLTDMESEKVSLRSAGDDKTVACFPKLESIEFHNMNNLKTWTGFQPGDFPCLKKLKYLGCELLRFDLPFIRELLASNPSVSIPKDHFNDSKSLLLGTRP